MENSLKDLSLYRLERAEEDLETAKENMDSGKYRASVNRSYYALFHALRAITALDGFDSSKHSGIIAYFNQNYTKNQVFDKEISRMIDTCYRLREKADYNDFFLVAKEDALKQYEKAQYVVKTITAYVNSIINA